MAMSDQQAYLDAAIARFGEPRIKIPMSDHRLRSDNGGSFYRTCYAWFPPPTMTNRGFRIDRYGDNKFEVEVYQHDSERPSVTMWTKGPPTDFEMLALMDLVWGPA
jgi:hypothetical protein